MHMEQRHDVLDPEIKESEQLKPEVSKNVVVMGVVSFFTDVASEMIYPLLPIFLTATLGAPMTVVGLMEGLAASVLNIVKVFSGWLSDKYQQRKIIVVIGYSISALAKLAVATSTGWQTAMFGKFLDRMGKGTRTSPRDALIADSTRTELRGRAFGLHRAIDNAGAILGPLLAIYLLFSLQIDMRSIFYIAFIPALIGVACLILFVKEVRTKSVSHKVFHFKFADLSPSFRVFLLISAVFALGNSADAFMILKAKEMGMSIASILILYSLLNLTHSLLSFPAGIAADKIGPKKVLLIGFLLFALTYLLFGSTTISAFLWLLFPLFGLYRGLTEGVAVAYVSNLVKEEHTATAIGFYQTIIGFGVLLASLIAGVLWEAIGPAAPFFFGGSMAIIASVLFVILEKKINHVSLFEATKNI